MEDQIINPSPDTANPDGSNPTDGLFGQRRRLGRGLNSLLGQASEQPGAEAAPIPASSEMLHIDINALHRNPFQPRKDFDLQALNELTESIASHGVLQPLLVRETPAGYQIIAGERRWLASRDAGLKQVPCRIMKLEDKVVSEVAIIENLQREDLNELEKAQAFQTYLDQFGCSVEELAQKMGKDRSTIANSLRLLELPNFVKEALRAGKISAGHGRAMLPLEEEADQIAMCQRIQSESMSVRTTEATIRAQLEEKQQTVPFKKGSGKPGAKAETPVNNHVQQLVDRVRELVGARVEIKQSGKDAGKIIIHFSSNDEFEKIVAKLKKAS
ncbi:MAG: parB-like partition protein [Planctomycetaceae bacterium]|nr:parB-like partition protein [Planctomycetaceae bacterium]